MHLCELVQHFETPSALAFFRSPEAREKSSKARALVESGRDWARELQESDLAGALFATIALGGSTLHMYRNSLEDLE